MTRIPGIDADIFPVNLGGNTFGWTSDATESAAVLDAFVAGGGNFVDTADSYSQWVPGNAGGESETILGGWMASRGNRDSIIVATKVGGLSSRKGLSSDNVRAAAEESLRRLRTDRIDLYYAHHDDPSQPIEAVALAFDELVRAGKVRAIGMSNLSGERQLAWLDAAASNGWTRPAAIQPNYSLVHRRSYESEYRLLAERNGLAVMPYYALASGFLTGKYRSVEDARGRARGNSAGQYVTAEGLRLLTALDLVAQSVGATPASVALAWLLAKGVTAPIASARIRQQVPALLAGAKLALSPSQVARLDAASQPYA